MEINKQLVKEEWIKTKLANTSFKVFNTNRTKNREATQFALLEIKINGHKEQIDIAVMDFNNTDMFLEHDQLMKHNSEVNWNKDMIQFTRCSKTCRTIYQNIIFKTKRAQATDTQDKGQQEIGKEPDPTNPEDLLKYIQSFTHLFNKKKFEKLPKQ